MQMEVVLVLRTHVLTHISNDENTECYMIIFPGTNARQLFTTNSLLIV
jgi:hypothetical protein